MFIYVLGWTIEVSPDKMVLSCLDTSHSPPDVRCSLVVSTDFSWSAYLYGKKLSPSLCKLFANTTSMMRSVDVVSTAVQCLDQSYVCIGNNDVNYLKLQHSHRGVFLDKSMQYVQKSIVYVYAL